MSETLRISGELTSKPLSGNPSGQANTVIPIDESMGIGLPLYTSLVLNTDAVQSINMGTLASVNTLLIRSIGGKVRVRITSADGSTQSIPCDPIMFLMSRSVDITALDIMRVPGVQTQVLIYMGQKDA